MPADVIGHEGGDEVVAMIIARLHPDYRLLTSLGACLFKEMRFQLLGEEIVGFALIDQQVRQT